MCPPPSLLPSTVVEACIQNTVEFRLMEGGMLVDVNYNFRDTKVCMDFDPQLCPKSNNIFLVGKESSVYK